MQNRSVTVNGDTFSFNQLKTIYDCYVRNVINICRNAEFAEYPLFGKLIHYVLSNFKQDKSPYFGNNKKFIELGLSVYNNGSHWILIVDNQKWREGGHRIEGLQRAAYFGLIPKNSYFLAFNHATVKEAEIEYFEAEQLSDFKTAGYETKKMKYKNYPHPELYRKYMRIPWGKFMDIPHMLGEAFWEYKKKYEEEFPSSPVCNDINVLKKCIANTEERISN